MDLGSSYLLQPIDSIQLEHVGMWSFWNNKTMNSLCGKGHHAKITTAALDVVCCGVVSYREIILHLDVCTLSVNATFQGTVLAQEQSRVAGRVILQPTCNKHQHN